MSHPPSPASSEASGLSEADSLAGRPSEGPRFSWSDLGLPVTVECQNAITALGCSQASSTSSRSRGRFKSSSRRGDHLRKTPQDKGDERPRDEYSLIASPSTTPRKGLPAPQQQQVTSAPSTPSRSRGRPPKCSPGLSATPKSKRGTNLNNPPSSRKSKRTLNLGDSRERLPESEAGDSSGRATTKSVPSRGGPEGPVGGSVGSPPSASMSSTRATSTSGNRASRHTVDFKGSPSKTPRAEVLPAAPHQQQISSTPSTPSRSRGRPSVRTSRLSTTPKSLRGAHLNKSTLSSGSSTSRDSSGRFSSTSKQPSTFGAAITRRAPATVPGGSSDRDAAGTAPCHGGWEGPDGVSFSSPPPTGSPPDVDAMRDTENCCPSDVTETPDALFDPTADPVFAEVLAKATELMTLVAHSQTATCASVTLDDLDSMTVIAHVPKQLPLVHLQRQLIKVSEEKDLIINCFNTHCGQGRLEGDVHSFCNFDDDDKGFTHLESGTHCSNVLRETEVYLIDCADRIEEYEWRYFLRQIEYCRVEKSSLVCFVLLGDARLNLGLSLPSLTTPDVLPLATMCRTEHSVATSLTQVIRQSINHGIDLQKYGPDQSFQLSGHHDNVHTIIAEGYHNLDGNIADLTNTALKEFPGQDEVLFLTCYDTPSSRLPNAESIFPLNAFRGDDMTPDFVPPFVYPQITKANLK